MPTTHTDTIKTDASLRDRLLAQRTTQPGARIRQLADALGVPEGAAIAALCGMESTRLAPRWETFFEELPRLGAVMALTRNDAVVHEKDGEYGRITFIGHMVQVANTHIDLRIFLQHWRHLFAVTQETQSGPLLSFQIFDKAGQAVHKIYLRPTSNKTAYTEIVRLLEHDDQSTDVAYAPAPAPRSKYSGGTPDVSALRSRWAAMKDTHDFYPMITEQGLTRLEACNLAGPDWAVPLAPAGIESLLQDAAADALPIMVFAGNAGCIQIHTGPVQQIKRIGPWLNVLDPDFNLHMHMEQITEAWLVRKPTVDGLVHSIECFDKRGHDVALFFGERKPGRPERDAWRSLAETTAARGAL